MARPPSFSPPLVAAALASCCLPAKAITTEWLLEANAIGGRNGHLSGYFDFNSNNQVTDFMVQGTQDFGSFVLTPRNSPISIQNGIGFSAININQPQDYYDPTGQRPIITTYNINIVTWQSVDFTQQISAVIPVAQDSYLGIFEVGQQKATHIGGANFQGTLSSVVASNVPEPSSSLLFAIGGLALSGLSFAKRPLKRATAQKSANPA